MTDNTIEMTEKELYEMLLTVAKGARRAALYRGQFQPDKIDKLGEKCVRTKLDNWCRNEEVFSDD